MPDFTIRQNDTLPALTASLEDFAGAKVNLSQATGVRFHLVTSDGLFTTKVNAAAAITDVANGGVSYTWQSADTSTPGAYYGEWEVTFVSGQVETYPNDGYISIRITRQAA